MERGEQSVNYEQAVAYIHGKYGKGVKRGLDNMYALLRRLGNPHEGLRYIHVAGTNGKGSTCAFLDAALRAQGYRVGLYTSPFLMRYNERMRINGCEIPDETLAALTTEVAAHVQAMEESGEGFPTVFEIGTAIVLTWFAREKVDVAVIEVGLGGTYDPTNVIRPEVSVIARIGLDHTRTLGSTLEEIAAVKGGILKPGRPAVLQAQGETVAAVIRGIAQEKQAPFLHCADWPPSAVALSARGARFTAGFPGLPAQEYEIRLPGAHQVDNAVTALAALSLLPEDLERFYPNTLLVTGYDIIFFWVARMIFSGCKQMGETPFAHVLIHGLVRDAQGRKMSKSLNNGIDPIQVIDQYGADALRFALIQGVAPGNDVRFSDEKVLSARNFANKVWNASRFALMNLEGPADDSLPKNIADKWILTRLNDAIRVVSEHLNDFDLAMAAQKLYDFIWSELCDWYLELAKAPLYGEDEKAASATRATLKYVLTSTLKLLHPFMPFVTEEIYSYLPHTQGSIMVSSWPRETESFPAEATAMQNIMDIIVAVRNLRAGMNVPPSKKAHLYIVPAEGVDGAVFAENETYFQRLASAAGVTVAGRGELPGNTVSAVCPCGEVFIPMGELVDAEKEIARLNKEIAAMEKEIARAEGKLNNPGFVGKAPAHVVEAERGKLATNRTMLEALQKRLEDMQNL